MSSHSGGLGAASPAGTSGEGGSAEWRRIYERLEALGADRARLEALNGIQHEFWSARDNINQARIHQAELSRGRWEAACKELLPGDSPSLTELLASDSEDSRLCNALFEIENSELKIQLKEVGTCIELNSTDHEQIARGLRTDLRKLKEDNESMCANKDKEVSALLAENDFLRNQLREMEKNNTALLKIKEVEVAQATEVTHKLQKFVEEMQLAAQNKDNEIGRSRAEAVNANKRVLILDGKLMEMHSIVEEKNDEFQNLLKIKEVEAAQATKEAQKLQQNIEELEVAAQNKDDEIGRLRAEAVDAENKNHVAFHQYPPVPEAGDLSEDAAEPSGSSHYVAETEVDDAADAQKKRKLTLIEDSDDSTGSTPAKDLKAKSSTAASPSAPPSKKSKKRPLLEELS